MLIPIKIGRTMSSAAAVALPAALVTVILI